MPIDLSRYHLDSPEALWLLLGVLVFSLLRPRGEAGGARWRSFVGLLLRCAAFAALVLALCGPHRLDQEPDLAIGAVVDLTGSTTPTRRAAYVEQLKELVSQSPVPVTLSAFTGDQLLPLRSANELDGLVAPPGSGSALGPALEAGIGALGPAGTRRLVLYSDGAATRGDLSQAQTMAQALDVALYASPPPAPLLDAEIVSAVAEQGLSAAAPIPVEVSVRASGPATGMLVLRDEEGTDLYRESVELGPGVQTVRLDAPGARSGIRVLRLELEVAGDAFAENNRHELRVRVLGTPRALVVGTGQGAAQLRSAVAGLRPPVELATTTSLDPSALSSYELVAAADPDLLALAPSQAEELAAWVRAGGTLVLSSGPNGLALERTPRDERLDAVRELLPVHLPRNIKEEPAPLAVVFLIDQSDSMGRGTKFDLALTGVLEAASLMSERARIGVVGFSDFPQWALPIGPAEDRNALLGALESMQVRGGTSIYPALQLAYEGLQTEDALLKHVILLSDGQSTTVYRTHGTVVDVMGRQDISLTTVAISAEADQDELRTIAERTGGRAYFTEDYSTLPSIFMEETVTVSRSNKVEEQFQVLAVEESRFLEGVSTDSIPSLAGHVRSRQKPSSELALATEDGDPLLVSWRYGRGAVTLFASELGGTWGASWSDWRQRDALLRQTLRASLEPPPPPDLELSGEVIGGEARVRFSALDSILNPRNDLVVEARLTNGAGARVQALAPSGPGLYEAAFPIEAEQSVLVEVAAVGEVANGVGASAGLPPGGETRLSLYAGGSEEALGPSLNLPLLERLAADTGGGVGRSVSEILTDRVVSRVRRVDVWPRLLWFALMLLGGELIVRRLRMPGRSLG